MKIIENAQRKAGIVLTKKLYANRYM